MTALEWGSPFTLADLDAMPDPEVPSLTVLGLEEGRYVDVATVVGDEPWQCEQPVRATIIPARLVD
jgi:hypothetical protein